MFIYSVWDSYSVEACAKLFKLDINITASKFEGKGTKFSKVRDFHSRDKSDKR